MLHEPGHLHHRNRTGESSNFCIDVAYEVVCENNNEPFLHLVVRSEISGQVAHDELKLSWACAMNFRKAINFIVTAHGLNERYLLEDLQPEVLRMTLDIRERFDTQQRARQHELQSNCSGFDSFTPGHLHRANKTPIDGQPAYCVSLYYDVLHDEKEGSILHMRLVGEVEGKPVDESFSLPRSTAYNFASVATRLAHKHGMPRDNGLIKYNHKLYDLMYADIRKRLELCSADASQCNSSTAK